LTPEKSRIKISRACDSGKEARRGGTLRKGKESPDSQERIARIIDDWKGGKRLLREKVKNEGIAKGYKKKKGPTDGPLKKKVERAPNKLLI